MSYFYYIKNNEPIWGTGQIVEIDEPFEEKKYNRGRILRNQMWVFGGVVRGNTTECFVEFVENSSRETLFEVISHRLAQVK